MRILVIAPHADDEVLGCGGMIAKAVARGDDVCVKVVTTGYGDKGRIVEMAKAAEVLGIQTPSVMLSGQDGFLDNVPQYTLVSAFDKVLTETHYDQVFIPYAHHHQDHRAVFYATMAALRISAHETPGLIAMYEHTLPAWNTFSSWLGRLYIDITDFIDRKTAALFCYKSQLRTSSPLSTEAVRTLAAERGMECGVQYAEMFYVLREMG